MSDANATYPIAIAQSQAILERWMRGTDAVAKCDNCEEPLSGTTYLCCGGPVAQEGAAPTAGHVGHTVCEQCATDEAYVENNRCRPCAVELNLNTRDQVKKFAGMPKIPAIRNRMASQLIEERSKAAVFLLS